MSTESLLTIGTLVGALVGFLSGYLSWRNRLDAMDKRFDTMDTKLQGISDKLETVARKSDLAEIKQDLRELNAKFHDIEKRVPGPSDLLVKKIVDEFRGVIKPLVRDRAIEADAPKAKEASVGGTHTEDASAKT